MTTRVPPHDPLFVQEEWLECEYFPEHGRLVWKFEEYQRRFQAFLNEAMRQPTWRSTASELP